MLPRGSLGMRQWHAFRDERCADLGKKTRHVVEPSRRARQPVGQRGELACQQRIDRVAGDIAVNQRIPGPVLEGIERPERLFQFVAQQGVIHLIAAAERLWCNVGKACRHCRQKLSFGVAGRGRDPVHLGVETVIAECRGADRIEGCRFIDVTRGEALERRVVGKTRAGHECEQDYSKTTDSQTTMHELFPDATGLRKPVVQDTSTVRYRRGLIALCAVAAACLRLSGVASAAGTDDFSAAIEAGNWANAAAVLQAMRDADPYDPLNELLGATLAWKRGDTDAARDRLRSLHERFPTLPEPLNNLAVIEAEAGNLDRARTLLEQALGTHPGYAAAYRNLGDLYTRLAADAYARALPDARPPAATPLRVAERIPSAGAQGRRSHPDAAAPGRSDVAVCAGR